MHRSFAGRAARRKYGRGRGGAPDSGWAAERNSALMEPYFCHIDSALGHSRLCPRELCPFWEQDSCTVTGLRADLRGTEGLPELLLRLRCQLGDPHASDDGPFGLR